MFDATMTELRKRGIDVNINGAGEPSKTDDWLRLFSSPTVSETGRHVIKHPNSANYGGMEEELNGNVPKKGMLTKNSREVIEKAGKPPSVNIISNNLYT
jgi:hypothetical protein